MNFFKRFGHQFLWDVKSQLWAIVALLVIGVLAVIYELRLFKAFDLDSESQPSTLWATLMVLAAITIALQFQRHPPANLRAHWISLPVGKMAMWASKITYLLLVITIVGMFMVLPAGIFSKGALLPEFIISYLVTFALLLCVVAVFSITGSNLVQVLVYSVICVIALVLVITIGEWYFQIDANNYVEGREESVLIPMGVLGWLSVCTVPFLAYKRRSKWLPFGFALAISLCVAILIRSWNTNLLRNNISNRSAQKMGLSDFDYRLKLKSQESLRNVRRLGLSSINSKYYRHLFADAVLKGVPDSLQINRVRHHGGLFHKGERVWMSGKAGSDLWGIECDQSFAFINVDDAQAFLDKELTFRGVATIDFVSLDLIAEIPWGKDSVIKSSEGILQINYNKINQREKDVLNVRQSLWTNILCHRDSKQSNLSFYIVHPIEGKRGLPNDRYRTSSRQLGLSSHRSETSISLPRELKELFTDDFLAECVVAIYKKQPKGSIRKPVEITNFTINQVNPEFKPRTTNEKK